MNGQLQETDLAPIDPSDRLRNLATFLPQRVRVRIISFNFEKEDSDSDDSDSEPESVIPDSVLSQFTRLTKLSFVDGNITGRIPSLPTLRELKLENTKNVEIHAETLRTLRRLFLKKNEGVRLDVTELQNLTFFELNHNPGLRFDIAAIQSDATIAEIKIINQPEIVGDCRSFIQLHTLWLESTGIRSVNEAYPQLRSLTFKDNLVLERGFEFFSDIGGAGAGAAVPQLV